MLILSYVIGLWFTLRTHAAVIWNTEIEEKKPPLPAVPAGNISHHPQGSQSSAMRGASISFSGSVGRNAVQDSQLYKRILGQSLRQVGLNPPSPEASRHVSTVDDGTQQQLPHSTPHLIPPKSGGGERNATETSSFKNIQIEGLSEEQNASLVRQVAEMAATAATVAAQNVGRAPKRASVISNAPVHQIPLGPSSKPGTIHEGHDDPLGAEQGAAGGHDAPNWSRLKSTVILLGATFLYAIIAEILVNTVDVVLESVDIDEKFLGITLFALVPNTTEFLVGQ